MIEKNKKYTYEELEKIVIEATAKTIDFMEEQSRKSIKRNKKTNKNSTADGLNLIIGLQNVAVLSSFYRILFLGKVK